MNLEEFKSTKAYKYAEWCINKDNKCVNKYIKILCNNFIYEINNQEKIDYFFDLQMAEKLVKLMKIINFATGSVAGQSFYSTGVGYQHFLFFNLFCWKEKSDRQKRRYETVILHLSLIHI